MTQHEIVLRASESPRVYPMTFTETDSELVQPRFVSTLEALYLHYLALSKKPTPKPHWITSDANAGGALDVLV